MNRILLYLYLSSVPNEPSLQYLAFRIILLNSFPQSWDSIMVCTPQNPHMMLSIILCLTGLELAELRLSTHTTLPRHSILMAIMSINNTTINTSTLIQSVTDANILSRTVIGQACYMMVNNIIFFIFYIITNFLLLNSCYLLLQDHNVDQLLVLLLFQTQYKYSSSYILVPQFVD